MKLIKLSNVNLFVKVDDKYYEKLNEHSYTGVFKDGELSGVCTSFKNRKANTTIPQLILKLKNVDDNLVGIYKDTDILNCQEDNLLFVEKQVKNRYKGPNKNNTSRYKGVSFDNCKKKWHTRLIIGGKKVLNKWFSNEDEAAIAYNNACKQYFNSECFLNTIGIDNRRPKIIHH